jgi:hypothetical protein
MRARALVGLVSLSALSAACGGDDGPNFDPPDAAVDAGVDAEVVSVEGTWRLTKSYTYSSPCPSFERVADTELVISGTTLAISTSDVTLVEPAVFGETPTVTFQVQEQWDTDESPIGYVIAPVSYELQLLAGPLRLEGPFSGEFPFHTETASTDCEYEGNASAVPVSP